MTESRLLLHELSKCYGIYRALDSVSLEVHAGELVVLVGANGSGKSTLMQCAAGLLKTNAGTIHVNGYDLVEEPLPAKGALGYAVEPWHLPSELHVGECLALFAAARGYAAIPIDSLHLADRLGLDAWFNRAISEISLGCRQKLSLCLAMLGNPPLLLLDESLIGLDPYSLAILESELVTAVRTRGCGILLSTHAIDLAERIADRVLLLHEGRLLHSWQGAELKILRTHPVSSLAAEMAKTMSAHAQVGRATPPWTPSQTNSVG